MMNNLIKKLNNFQAVTRLFICFGMAVLVLSASLFFKLEKFTSLMLTWDTFCFCMIMFSWITFFTIPHLELCVEVRKQDESRSGIFILVLCSICISLVGILILLKSTNVSHIQKEVQRISSFLGIALSWVLLHTVFTLRYAHHFYIDNLTISSANGPGLDFPNEKEPDYLDFAYFSFVVGMTFQVSDVQITSKYMRRLVLLHSLISFIFNTIIVALTISIISGMSK